MRSPADIFPISLSSGEAGSILANSKLRELSGNFAREILDKNPTPLEAQAVLVEAWDTVLKNAHFTFIRKDLPKEGVL